MPPQLEMSPQEAENAVAIARSVAREFDKVGARHDRDNTFPEELVPIFKRSGLAGLNVPKRFGGMGADLWTTARCVQELAKGDPACTLGFNMHLGVVGFFRGMWSEADQMRFFPRVAKDQALLDKIAADQKYASEVLKVDSTPTFFINGEKIKGETSFEEFDKRIKAQLKS